MTRRDARQRARELMELFRLGDQATTISELSGRHAAADPVRAGADAPPAAAHPGRADRRGRRRAAGRAVGYIRGLHAAGTTVLLTTHYLEEAEAALR